MAFKTAIKLFKLFRLVVLGASHLVVLFLLCISVLLLYPGFFLEHYPPNVDGIRANATFQTSKTIIRAQFFLILSSGLFFVFFWLLIDQQYLRSSISVTLGTASLVLAIYNKSMLAELKSPSSITSNKSVHCADDVSSPRAPPLSPVSTLQESCDQVFEKLQAWTDFAFLVSVVMEITILFTIAVSLFLPRRLRLPSRYEPTIRLLHPRGEVGELYDLQDIQRHHGGSLPRPLSNAFKNQTERRTGIVREISDEVRSYGCSGIV